jgi:hypothetical protein
MDPEIDQADLPERFPQERKNKVVCPKIDA